MRRREFVARMERLHNPDRRSRISLTLHAGYDYDSDSQGRSYDRLNEL